MQPKTRGAQSASDSAPARASDPVAAAPEPRPLGALLGASGVKAGPGPLPVVSDIASRSSDVRAGALFVALKGTRRDGHAFIDEAVAGGAAAVLVEAGYYGSPGVPVIPVPDTRTALARVAAEWYGRPADRLRMVGITGSLGKTSTLAMLESTLAEAGVRAGTIGSLGVRLGGETVGDSAHTAPDPLFLHRELARLEGAGCGIVAMEVTSHALDQDRVHGLRYDLGLFLNLVPLEHSEYHDSFRAYARAKTRFFEHMNAEAPVVFNVDDLVVRRIVRDSGLAQVGCGTGPSALLRRVRARVTARGSRFELVARRPLPRLDGTEHPPVAFEVRLPLLGRSNADNATHAATAALVLGLEPDLIVRALGATPQQPRRLHVVRGKGVTILDDTVGHPDSVSAACDVARRLRPRRVHIAYAVRGRRGAAVNTHTATALAIWARRLPLATLVVTTSEDAADDRNRVSPEERAACEAALQAHGVRYELEPGLDRAVDRVLDRAGPGDLVLLLGAQGMDRGQERARERLGIEAPG